MELPLTLLVAPTLSFLLGLVCARFRSRWMQMSAAVLLPMLVIPWLYWCVFIATESGSRQQEQIGWAPVVIVPALGFSVLASICAVWFSRANLSVRQDGSRS